MHHQHNGTQIISHSWSSLQPEFPSDIRHPWAHLSTTFQSYSSSEHRRMGCTLRVYSSVYWNQVYQISHSDNSPSFKLQWDRLLVEEAITLLWRIWSDRNNRLHGTTKDEAQQKLRDHIIGQVKQVYLSPPRLQKWYSKITDIPLSIRLKRNTTNLQRWLSRVNHQRKVSSIIRQRQANNQLSLMDAYRRAQVCIPDCRKYPPYIGGIMCVWVVFWGAPLLTTLYN